jgi:hypothetical protein
MTTIIRKGLPLLAAAVFTAAATGNAQTISTSRFCNNWLIAGVYGFTIEGTKLSNPPGTNQNAPLGPQVGVAITQFDGKGGLIQLDSVTIAGIQSANLSETPTLGTYAVNADCTGTFTLNFTDGRPTVTTYFVVVDDGKEIDTMVKGVPPNTIAGVIATRSIGKRRFSFDFGR